MDRLQLCAAAGAGQHHSLGAGLRVGLDAFQRLIQRAEAQRGAAGHYDRGRVGAGGNGGLQLANLLLRGDQARVGHIELSRHEVVLDLYGCYSSGLHLTHGAHHVDRVAEPVLGIHHQRDVGDTRDAPAVVHHVGHIGQHDVGYTQVCHLSHGS